MTKKPTSLSDVMAKKAAAVAPIAAVAKDEGKVVTRTLTLRLPEVPHDQLREMAFVSRRSQHELIMEALNDLFVKYGKPPTAPVQS
jgi:hypothetical protein